MGQCFTKGNKMNSALIAVIVEQHQKIVELESQISRLNQAQEAYVVKGVEEMSAELSVELLTPEVVNNWERVAIQQLQSKREKISIPTTLLLAMIHKIQANEVRNEHD